MSIVIDDSEGIKDSMGIAAAINAVACLQGHFIDRLSLHHAISGHSQQLIGVDESNWVDCLHSILSMAGIKANEVEECPDPARLPAKEKAKQWFDRLKKMTLQHYKITEEEFERFCNTLDVGAK